MADAQLPAALQRSHGRADYITDGLSMAGWVISRVVDHQYMFTSALDFNSSMTMSPVDHLILFCLQMTWRGVVRSYIVSHQAMPHGFLSLLLERVIHSKERCHSWKAMNYDNGNSHVGEPMQGGVIPPNHGAAAGGGSPPRAKFQLLLLRGMGGTPPWVSAGLLLQRGG